MPHCRRKSFPCARAISRYNALMYGYTLIEVGLLILAGIATGFVNVFAGGGSMFSVPALIFLGIPGPVANGTNRIAIVAQTAASVLAFKRKGFSDFKLSASLSLFTLPGAIIGAFSATKIRNSDFNVILAGVMVIVMALTFIGQKNKKALPSEGPDTSQMSTILPSRARLIWGHLAMVVLGFWGGFIQIGAGFILIPILHRIMGFDLLRTNVNKVMISFLYTVVTLVVFARELEIAWAAGLFVALGTIIGSSIAVQSHVTKGNDFVRWMINAILAVFIIKLLLFTG